MGKVNVTTNKYVQKKLVLFGQLPLFFGALFFGVLLLSLFLWPVVALGADRECEGYLYRSKRNGVPVFDEAKTTGRVLGKLRIGQKVCYIGETNDFAIVNWDTYLVGGEEEPKSHAYIRLVELWEPNNLPKKSGGFFGRMKQMYHYMRSGGVPERGIFPYASPLKNKPLKTGAPKAPSKSGNSSKAVSKNCKDKTGKDCKLN